MEKTLPTHIYKIIIESNQAGRSERSKIDTCIDLGQAHIDESLLQTAKNQISDAFSDLWACDVEVTFDFEKDNCDR